MLTKSLAAAAAIAALVATIAPVTQAEAKTNVFIGVGFGGYGYDGWGNGYGNGYGGGMSCWKGKKVVQWAGFHHVNAYDCGGPVYGFKAKKNGKWYKVKVSWNGNIISVKHI